MTDTLTIDWVDPATLRVIDQVRDDATPDDNLVESVRTKGVLQPPIVTRNDAGELLILFGHRRVGAAIIAKLPAIPVIIREDVDPTDAERVEDQMVENLRRQDLSAADQARGFQQLALFGRTPEDIAQAVAEQPTIVQAGLRIARSKKVSELVTSRPAIDLETAARIAEFDDEPKAQARLAETAEQQPQNFRWLLEEETRKRAVKIRKAELTQKLKDDGVRVVTVSGYMGYRGKDDLGRDLDLLVDDAGKKITPKAHRTCPGHVGYVFDAYRADDVKLKYACTDYAAHGHQPLHAAKAPAPSAEELERRAAREAELARVEANRAARRQWIRDLLPGKINQLAGVYEYMAAALLERPRFYGDDHRSPEHTLQLLGHDTDDNLTELVTSGQVAPFRLLLATAFGIHEERVEHGQPRWVVRHFTYLQRWGYTLSDVDQAAADTAAQQLADEEASAAETEGN